MKRQGLEAALAEERFRLSDNAAVTFPGDAGFSAATERWNAYKAPSFFASISVGTETDVATAVSLARHFDIPFLATSSRHGYGGTMAKLKYGLSLDLSHLNSIEVSKTTSTLTVGPGATNGDIVGPVNAAGFELATGSCSGVSQIGITIGAGVSRWSGVYGLVGDALMSARVVTHDGQVVNASETENPGLFWGLRGAGANLGIVVSATYKLQRPVGDGSALVVDVVLSPDQKTEYFKLAESVTEKQPARLAIVNAILWYPEVGGPVLGANWVWFGPEEEGRRIMTPLIEMKSITTVVNPMPWTEVTAKVFFGFDAMAGKKGGTHGMYSAALRRLDVTTCESTVDKMVRFYEEHPEGRGSATVMEFFPPPAVQSVTGDAMAYPWRDATGHIMFQFAWPNTAASVEDAVHVLAKELREDFGATSGYSGLSVYVNYAVGDEKLEQIYGKDKLPRLLELKRQWDPNNVFCHHHPLQVDQSC